jgi:general L-amino acid transport system substrate-binding protein
MTQALEARRDVGNVITDVGTYREAFERNLGTATPIGMDPGLNALWTRSGLLFAPPPK